MVNLASEKYYEEIYVHPHTNMDLEGRKYFYAVTDSPYHYPPGTNPSRATFWDRKAAGSVGRLCVNPVSSEDLSKTAPPLKEAIGEHPILELSNFKICELKAPEGYRSIGFIFYVGDPKTWTPKFSQYCCVREDLTLEAGANMASSVTLFMGVNDNYVPTRVQFYNLYPKLSIPENERHFLSVRALAPGDSSKTYYVLDSRKVGLWNPWTEDVRDDMSQKTVEEEG